MSIPSYYEQCVYRNPKTGLHYVRHKVTGVYRLWLPQFQMVGSSEHPADSNFVKTKGKK